jgi:spore germination cell wall hydrolase CwlJ-like protein
MDSRPNGRIAVNWPQLRLLASVALPIIMASCVPAQASHSPDFADAARASAHRKAQGEPRDEAARERVARRVAELFAPVSSEPAEPFDLSGQGIEDNQRALDCLTSAIYYEARSEPEDGQRAVAQVVLNRVRHPAFPSTVCGVVFQGSHRRTGCQFSFTCDGSMRGRRQQASWARARAIAAEALSGSVYSLVGNATHYHTTAILPYWAKHLSKSAIVGAHIFYRWAGNAGEASAFRQTYGGLEAAPGLQMRIASSDVDVHRGTPRFWRETVEVDNGSSNITIHRGPSALPEAEPVESDHADGEDRSQELGVRVHHGSAPVN